MKDHVFHDGTLIPAGASIWAPADAIAHDPDIYKDPDFFDGLRFHKLREQQQQEDNKHWLFSSSNEESLVFGYGVQSCPGRWFAAREILLTLSMLLLDYEIEDDESNSEASFKRVDVMLAPPSQFKMRIRKREGHHCMFPRASAH